MQLKWCAYWHKQQFIYLFFFPLTLFEIRREAVRQVITRQETGVWKMQGDTRRLWWDDRSADIDWTWKLKGRPSRLTLQFELLLLDHRAFVREVARDHILQVSRTAWLRLGSGQDICNGLFLLLKIHEINIMIATAQSVYGTVVVPLCNSRWRQSHLSLLFGFSGLFLFSFFPLRNYSLFLWNGAWDHTVQANLYMIIKLRLNVF